MAAPKKINLLTQEGFEHTKLGRALNWALSAGRIVVIVTELVVIVAFLSRFWLDRTLTDLNSQNLALQTQVEASAEFEKQFRSAQERLSTYQKIAREENINSELVKKISLLLPADVSLTSILFSENEIDIKGIALSEAGLAGFVKALDDSPEFENPVIRDISLDTSFGQIINFTVNTERSRSGSSRN